MTSDVIHNKHAQGESSFVPAHKRRLELTREEAFLDGRDDIFDILAGNSQKHNFIKENMGRTVNFLNRAKHMLDSAEQKISEQNARIQDIEKNGDIDLLTGLLNRNGFSKALIREIARTNRGYNDGGLIVIFNFENLKHIQDHEGHKAANTALKLISRALESEIREMDVAARIDDDEFVLLFAETTMSEALSRLQAMALRLNRLSLIWSGEEIRISLSLGLKSFQKGASAETVFKDACTDLNRNRRGPKTAASA